eukprot:gene25387-30655_t
MGGANSGMVGRSVEVKGHPLVQGYVEDIISHTVEKQAIQSQAKVRNPPLDKTTLVGEEEEDLLASYLQTTKHGQDQLAEYREKLTSNQKHSQSNESNQLQSSIDAVEKDLVLLLAMKHYPEFIASSTYQNWMFSKAQLRLQQNPNLQADSSPADVSSLQEIWSDEEGKAVFLTYLHAHHRYDEDYVQPPVNNMSQKVLEQREVERTAATSKELR